MANPYRKLSRGAKVTEFSVTAYNRMLDVVDWFNTQGISGGGKIRKVVDWDQSVFRVKNDTGVNLVSYDPVGLDGPIFDPDADGERELLNQTSMMGVYPDPAYDAGGKWGVMLEATPIGAIGRCCLSGVVPVRAILRSTDDKCVDVGDDETWPLETGSSGAQILWIANGTVDTVVWAIVRLGAVPPSTRFAWATTTAAVAIADATFTVTSILLFDGSTWSGDDPLTVQNSPDRFAIDSGTAGKIVYCKDSSGDFRWHPLDFACPANCECDVE